MTKVPQNKESKNVRPRECRLPFLNRVLFLNDSEKTKKRNGVHPIEMYQQFRQLNYSQMVIGLFRVVRHECGVKNVQ